MAQRSFSPPITWTRRSSSVEGSRSCTWGGSPPSALRTSSRPRSTSRTPRSTTSSSTTAAARSKPEEPTVTQLGQGALSAASARPAAPPELKWPARVYGFIDKTLMIVELEIWKLRRDPTELVTRAIQPMLWLLLFGEVFSHIRAIPTGNLPYLDFMAPGILAQSVLFVAIFYGISAIWERDLGVVHKLLVTPTPRSALILGKALSAGVRGLSQAVIIYALALVLGVRISWNPLAIAGVLVFVLIGAALFSTFSLIIATIVKTRERFMGIG